MLAPARLFTVWNILPLSISIYILKVPHKKVLRNNTCHISFQITSNCPYKGGIPSTFPSDALIGLDLVRPHLAWFRWDVDPYRIARISGESSNFRGPLRLLNFAPGLSELLALFESEGPFLTVDLSTTFGLPPFEGPSGSTPSKLDGPGRCPEGSSS
jgi:hypothetical protein